jgi:hypothetical protein
MIKASILNIATALTPPVVLLATVLITAPGPAMAQTQAQQANTTPCPTGNMIEGHYSKSQNGQFWFRAKADCTFAEPSNYNDDMVVTRISFGATWIYFQNPAVLHPAFDQQNGIRVGRGCLSKDNIGNWIIIPDATTCSLLPTPVSNPIVVIKPIPTGPANPVEVLPDCGIGSTDGGEPCWGYLIHRLNHYPGNFQNSYSLSILPSNYPTLPRCINRAPQFNSRETAKTGCIRKYIWTKPKSPETMNGSPQVTNPPSSVELMPPN